MIAGEKGDRTIEIKFPSNKALRKIISPLDTMEFKEMEEQCMEKDEQHIQSEDICIADMDELYAIKF